jgi:hypothetical protein
VIPLAHVGGMPVEELLPPSCWRGGPGGAERPTLGPAMAMAMATGLGSTAAPWLVMQPAFGLGVAAAKTPDPTDPDPGSAGRLKHPSHSLGYLRAVGELAHDADLHVKTIRAMRSGSQTSASVSGIPRLRWCCMTPSRAGGRGYSVTVVVRSLGSATSTSLLNRLSTGSGTAGG